MPSLSFPRHPAARAALVALVLLFVLVITTSVVRTSTVDAQQARVAAAEAAAAAEAREEAAAEAAAAREQAERDEAERLALLEVAQTREATVVAIAAAQAVHDGSLDRVADDGVRVALAAAIAAASAALEAPLVELQAAAAALATAQVAVTDAQTAWDAEQARLAAEAAAAQAAQEEAAKEQASEDAAAQPAPGAAAPAPAPQCVNDSTYTGPPFYTSAPGAGGDGSNGNIPSSQMTQLAWGHDSVGTPQYLRTPAAQALDRLNAAYRARFGGDLDLDLTYRSYDSQVAMRNELGSIAAVPGTSTHGTGDALDVPEWSCYAFGSVRRDWLVTNGPSYGWVSPSWARQGSSNPEYWHYEYTG